MMITNALCGKQAKVYRSSPGHFDVRCSVCGIYLIGDLALARIEKNPQWARKLANWVFHQTRNGIEPRVVAKDLDGILSLPAPSVARRKEMLLAELVRMSGGELYYQFSPTTSALIPASYSTGLNDVLALLDTLEKSGALRPPIGNNLMTLTVEGWEVHERLGGQRAMLAQAFVAMSFNSDLRPLYAQGIEPAVRSAGYEALRIDGREHDGRIDDRIIAEIRRSKFIVADFTGHRGGVYYEVGFAHGLGSRAIFTCRADDLEHLHFDVRQYNTITWEDPTDVIKPLQNRMLAIFGAGPLQRDAQSIP